MLTLAAALLPTLPRITCPAYPHKDWNNAVEDWDRHHRHHGSTEVGGSSHGLPLSPFSSQLEGDEMGEMREGQWAIRELEWQRHQRQKEGGGGDRPDEAKDWPGAINSVASHQSFLSYSPTITPVGGGAEMTVGETTAGETGGSEIQSSALRVKDLRSKRMKLHAFLHADDDAPYPRAAAYVSLVNRNC